MRVPLLLLACLLPLSAAADEILVLADTAFQPVVQTVAPAFEKRTRHTVVVLAAGADAVAARIREGEGFDLAVLPPDLLEKLGREGTIADGSITPLAKGKGVVYAGAVSTGAYNSNAALALLIQLASEETQMLLKDKGLQAP